MPALEACIYRNKTSKWKYTCEKIRHEIHSFQHISIGPKKLLDWHTKKCIFLPVQIGSSVCTAHVIFISWTAMHACWSSGSFTSIGNFLQMQIIYLWEQKRRYQSFVGLKFTWILLICVCISFWMSFERTSKIQTCIFKDHKNRKKSFFYYWVNDMRFSCISTGHEFDSLKLFPMPE